MHGVEEKAKRRKKLEERILYEEEWKTREEEQKNALWRIKKERRRQVMCRTREEAEPKRKALWRIRKGRRRHATCCTREEADQRKKRNKKKACHLLHAWRSWTKRSIWRKNKRQRCGNLRGLQLGTCSPAAAYMDSILCRNLFPLQMITF